MSEPPAPHDPFLLAGVTIDGKYRIDAVVGDGGFGVVYRAIHLGFGEPIAVKCLKLPHALDGKQRDGFLEQLREEGRLLHRLSKATPGIVQALDVGAVTTAEGAWVPYLVLEWLDGETLADHLAARVERALGPLPLADAVRLLEPAARALGVAHALKVAHRDVKPQNLFVARVGDGRTLKVLDFGIAKVLTDYTTFTSALDATKATPAAFTPRYGAPEQFNKQRGASGPWTDVFALGLIFVELLTGKKALDGDDPTQLYVAAADPTMRPTPRARGADVPEAVERVLDKALAIEPRHRFADAGAMWDALTEAAGLAPSAALRSSISLPGDRPSAAVPPTEAMLAAPGADGVAPTRQATAQAQAAFEPTRPATPSVMGGAPRPSSPSPSGDPSQTAASPGAPPRVTADPMSETPFFDRHQLPPSEKAAPAAPAALAAPPTPRRSPWAILALVAVVLAGGAAAATLASPPEPSARPATSASASASARKRPLPPRRPDAGAPRPTASAAAPASASAAASASSEPAAPPPDMVLVTPGAVKLGEREVTVARGFYLDRTEVTVRSYEGCVAKRRCGAADHVTLPPGFTDRWTAPAEGDAAAVPPDYAATLSRRCNAGRDAPDHPVNCVDFASAEAYCRWVGKRLPTEAEWALAAAGAEGRAYPWGSEPPECGRACFGKSGACLDRTQEASTCAAGGRPADRTPEGIFDLGGNVSEWVSDGSADRALRVTRGGSFVDDAGELRSTFRAPTPPGVAHVAVGFRCAMDGPAPRP